MKILKLTLEKRWFDMILSGEKLEEYREIKPYWCQRFILYRNNLRTQRWWHLQYFIKPCPIPHILHGIEVSKIFRMVKYDAVEFTNGYGKDKPRVTMKLRSIKTGVGVPEWGAKGEQEYFKLQLGEKISSENLDKKIA